MDEADRTRDQQTISSVISSWYRAMENGDVAALISLVTPDVIVKTPGATAIAGSKALEQALSTFLLSHSETVEFEVKEIEISDGFAYAITEECATIHPKSGGDSAILTGMHLTILRHQPDGRWLVARDISSLINTE